MQIMKYTLFTLLLAFSLLSFGQIAGDPAAVDAAMEEGVSQSDIDRYLAYKGKRKSGELDLKSFLEEDSKAEKLSAVDSAAAVAKNVYRDSVQWTNDSIFMNRPRSYGLSLFDKGDLKVFKAAGHSRAPENYVLGVGDELNISIWGNSEHQEAYTINGTGAIEPRIVGRVYLRGLTFGDAKKIIASRFGKVYDLKNSKISIELNYSKVIRVNIVGEVRVPGTYAVSSINSAFNVLSIAGGLTDLASVRNIYVKRNNNKVKVLDVYKFLTNPIPENDFFLEDNDYIVVAAAGNVVEVRGEVKRPGLYEMKEKEGVKELLTYSGGLSKMAIRNKARLETYEGDKQVFKDIDLVAAQQANLPLILKDGDVVEFAKIVEGLRNFVVVSGAVNVPGSYEFQQGDKVLDIVKKAQGVRYDTYMGRAFILRTHTDNIKERLSLNLNEITKNPVSANNYLVQEFDEIMLYEQQRFVDSMFVSIRGSVRKPVRVVYSSELTVQDLIFIGGGLLREAANGRIEISRISNFAKEDSDEPTRVVIETVAVSNDLELGSQTPIKLQPNDIVFVRNTPDYYVQKNIVIVGEVNYPGTYSLTSKTERISSILERAGGITEWAFLEAATLHRSEGTTKKTPVIMNLKAMVDRKNKAYDYILQEGDSLVIPATRNVVALFGAIDYPKVDSLHSVYTPFIGGKSARFFVKEFGGGFSEEARRSQTYVESPGGQVKRTKNYGLFKIYPKVKVGDKIVVAYKPPKTKAEEKLTDWGAVISKTTSQLTSVISLYLLLRVATK